jgi:hypothetical protein
MKRLTLLLSLFLAFSTAAFAQSGLSSHSFTFKHKDAERAAALIKPLMSEEGSVSMQPKTRTLIVTDRGANVRSIVEALAKFDVPAQSFRIQVKIVAASRGAAQPKVPDDLKEISAKLSGVLKFNSFEKLGEIDARVKEGDPFVADKVAETYRADFTLGEYDPLSDSVRVNDLRIQKRQAKEGQSSEIVQLLKTSLNLKLGQTIVMGAAKTPDSNRTLMVVLLSQRD